MIGRLCDCSCEREREMRLCSPMLDIFKYRNSHRQLLGKSKISGLGKSTLFIQQSENASCFLKMFNRKKKEEENKKKTKCNKGFELAK